MNHALNATAIKHANQRLILDAVFRAGTTSRTQLAQELCLSKPAISDNLKPLLDLGIIDESGVGSAGPSGGRKSILLRFNARHRLIVAANLNFSNPVFALSDLSGNILNSFDITIAPGTAIEACRDLVLGGVRMLLQSQGANHQQVLCIAIAAPGVFNPEGDLTHYSTSCGGPQWWRVHLKETMEEAFSLPVILCNDVKAATLGEWVHGAGKGVDNLFYLHAGLGIGSGIILDGKPLMGENYSAGEIADNFDPLNGGNGRRLEDSVCIEYLERECLRRPDSPFVHRQQVPMEEIILAYQAGDPMVLDVVNGICQRLAVLSHNYMTFLSINYIVFGGDYTPFGDCLRRHLTQLFRGSLWTMPNIQMSILGKYAGIQGMIVLARDHYFEQICS